MVTRTDVNCEACRLFMRSGVIYTEERQWTKIRLAFQRDFHWEATNIKSKGPLYYPSPILSRAKNLGGPLFLYNFFLKFQMEILPTRTIFAQKGGEILFSLRGFRNWRKVAIQDIFVRRTGQQLHYKVQRTSTDFAVCVIYLRLYYRDENHGFHKGSNE